MLNLPLCHWSSQLFDLRAPSSTDVPVLLLNQPIVGFNRGRQHLLIKTCRTQSKRSDQQLSDYCQTNDKLTLYLSVIVFSTKVLIRTLFLRLQLETGPPFNLSSEPPEGLAACSEREYLYFSVILNFSLFCLKVISWIILSLLFKALNHRIVDKKNLN